MDEDELEVAPCEEDLFTVDESLPPVEAILRYSNSHIPAQRHAYIKPALCARRACALGHVGMAVLCEADSGTAALEMQGMGAAALHCNSAAEACRLIHAALRLLPESQGEGAHELAGDELAEVLILKQLGTLGEAVETMCAALSV
eukprot:scaffold14248_cov21-Tisochrysis_lutea.AAC.1